MNSTRLTRWLVYLLIGAAVAAVLWSYSSAPAAQNDIPISRLAQEIKSDEVSELIVSSNGREVTVVYENRNQQPTRASISDVSSLEEVLAAYGISSDSYEDDKPIITYERPSQWGGLLNIVGIFLPALLIVGFFSTLSFGKRREPITRRCLSARAVRACSPVIIRQWDSMMWPGAMRPRKSCRRSLNF